MLALRSQFDPDLYGTWYTLVHPDPKTETSHLFLLVGFFKRGLNSRKVEQFQYTINMAQT